MESYEQIDLMGFGRGLAHHRRQDKISHEALLQRTPDTPGNSRPEPYRLAYHLIGSYARSSSTVMAK